MTPRATVAIISALALLGAGVAWVRLGEAPAAVPSAGVAIAVPPIVVLPPHWSGDRAAGGAADGMEGRAAALADELADALARPPFAPSRRPPPPVVTPRQAQAIAASAPVPVAIVTGGAEPLAMLRIQGVAKPVRVRLGDTVAGWQLRGVEPGAILMQDRAGGLFRLPLARATAPPPGSSNPRSAAGRPGIPPAGSLPLRARDDASLPDGPMPPDGDEEVPRGLSDPR